MKKEQAIAKAKKLNETNYIKNGIIGGQSYGVAYDMHKETYVTATSQQIFNSSHLRIELN